MITPNFNVSQNEEFILIDVKINHIRFNSATTEMVVEDNLFIFSLAPYYLRLRFSHGMVDDERATAKLNSATEEINIMIPKANKGEVFEDLDLHAKLLARSNEVVKDRPTEDSLMTEVQTTVNNDNLLVSAAAGQGMAPAAAAAARTSGGPLIEELDAVPSLDDNGINQAEDFNWEIEQKIPSTDTNVNLAKVKYGFNNQYDSIIEMSMSNGNDINELADPEHTTEDQRVMERLIKENIKFDHEYYAADYILQKHPADDDDKGFNEILNWKNPITQVFLKFNKQQQHLKNEIREGRETTEQANLQNFPDIEFTQKEKDQMIDLPRKTYLVDNPAYSMYTILSLLFGYCFDQRENEGDTTTESAWTVGKLTPQIAMLDTNIISSESSEMDLLKAIVITSTRRALSYPLHRNYELVLKTWDDVYYQLRAGKRYVLRNLLALREFFRYHDVYYVYCKILLDDLLAWYINDVNENAIRKLAHDMRQAVSNMNKTDITFEKVIGEEEDKVEDMVTLDLAEIEAMADEMYESQFGQ